MKADRDRAGAVIPNHSEFIDAIIALGWDIIVWFGRITSAINFMQDLQYLVNFLIERVTYSETSEFNDFHVIRSI
jgi:hypothetical protein